MIVVYFILLLLALICFAVAAVSRRRHAELGVELVALGLAFWVAVPLLQTLQV